IKAEITGMSITMFTRKSEQRLKYVLNYSNKTRFMSGAKKIEVTGVVLNSGKLSIGRDKKKNLRAALFKLAMGSLPQENVNKTIGMLSFLKDIEPERHAKLLRVFKGNLKRFQKDKN
ncbi:MAG: hypothetical protein JW863_08245, partial [Chitinispirillaceae bacterium]|nr:hypothetical protein [Chitinispirillaceae bacterium]